MSTLTKIPLDAIRVDSSITHSGYLLYDRVQNKIVIANEQSTVGAINRSGDTILEGISYSSDLIQITDPNQLVSASYVNHTIDILRLKWDDYLPTTGGTMTGQILLASTDTGDACATKGQVDSIMRTDNFVSKSGGTMKQGLKLHSTNSQDYGEYDAVPKIYVDNMVSTESGKVTQYFNNSFLGVGGGTMTGALYQNPPSNPYDDNHILTMGFVRDFVTDYVSSTDWSCTNVSE